MDAKAMQMPRQSKMNRKPTRKAECGCHFASALHRLQKCFVNLLRTEKKWFGAFDPEAVNAHFSNPVIACEHED